MEMVSVMPEYSIQKTDFEKQKKKLKTFAEQPATSTELDKFSTGGKWSDFCSGGLPGVLSGHKVTGKEMNSFVAELQSCFAEINEHDRKVIKEFGQVYETFEALDKGYIQGILIGVKSAEKASQEAKDAQKDIDDTIKNLQITINKFKQFKDEIKEYSHLKDIDKIWGDIQRFDKELKSVSQRLKDQGTGLDSRISELAKFKALIEKQKHLNDIDSIWKDVQAHREKIEGFPDDLEALSIQLTKRIDEMFAFKAEIDKSKHLKDIDSIWENTKALKGDISKLSESIAKKIGGIESDFSKIDELINGQNHFRDIDTIWENLQELRKSVESYNGVINGYSEKYEALNASISEINDVINNLQTIEHLKDVDDEWDFSHGLLNDIEAVNSKVSSVEKQTQEYDQMLQSFETDNLQLREKIKVAYIIAGGAIGLSVIQLILQLMGIL